MSAAPFTTYEPGADPAAAFRAAHARASYEHGQDGDTRTIASKGSYTVIVDTALPYDVAHVLAQKLIAAADERISDTGGPAGAIPVRQTTRRQLATHDIVNQGVEPDAEALRQLTARARAVGLIGPGETVTAGRRYDHVRTTPTLAEDAATAEPDGWLFFGWAGE